MSYRCPAAVVAWTSLAATEEPVTLEECKRWIKVDETDVADDEVIQRLLTTARQRYEVYTQRSLLVAGYSLVLEDAPNEDYLETPRSPLVSVTSITGYDITEQTDTGGTAMSSSEYYVDTAHEPSRIVTMGGSVWPTATRETNGFIVRFTAGYSTSTTGVPEEAKQTILQMVARAYEHRGDQDSTVQSMMDDVLESDSLSLPEWG